MTPLSEIRRNCLLILSPPPQVVAVGPLAVAGWVRGCVSAIVFEVEVLEHTGAGDSARNTHGLAAESHDTPAPVAFKPGVTR